MWFARVRAHFAPLVSLALLLLLATGCGASAGPWTPAADGSRLLVATSFTVLADLIRQVGGERIEVRPLVPIGADPNTYQPAPRDVAIVARARLVFLNGLGLDRTTRTVVNNANRPDLPLYVLSDDLPTLESSLSDVDAANGVGRANPYLWLDPRLAGSYVERIRDGLAQVDPAGAAAYRANAADYLARLTSLDAELEARLAVIPPARRQLVTLHDAFPYLAARYGFELVGVVIRTPGRSPSAQEIADVWRTLRQRDVRTVFTEPQIDSRLLKLAARDAGLGISTLYSDTLDRTVPSYEALLRYNARHLVDGLSYP